MMVTGIAEHACTATCQRGPATQQLHSRCAAHLVEVTTLRRKARTMLTLAARFASEATAIKAHGFVATKTKLGFGPKDAVELAAAMKEIGDNHPLMADADHCTTHGTFHRGRVLGELDPAWFKKPVAPEDHAGYQGQRAGLKADISVAEAEFSQRAGALLESHGMDIAPVEVRPLRGIT
jgi:D-galactarolactone cycloisomerase